MERTVPDLRVRIRTGIEAGVRTSLQILKITVPLYVAVDLLSSGLPSSGSWGASSPRLTALLARLWKPLHG